MGRIRSPPLDLYLEMTAQRPRHGGRRGERGVGEHRPAPEGTRFLADPDWAARFEPGGALRGRLAWFDMCAYHAPGNGAFTLLRVAEREIVAAACFQIRRDDLFVDFLARNARLGSAERLAGGSILLEAVEIIAKTRGLDSIRLESVEDPQTIAWYRHHGFVPDGEPYPVEGWGRIHPMIKRV